MRRFLFFWIAWVFVFPPFLCAGINSSTPRVVVFWQKGFPFIDTVPISRHALTQGLQGLKPEFISQKNLGRSLSGAALLVWPYGSAFPEKQWPEIKSFAQRGGNILILGGRPFAVAVDQFGKRETSVFGRELLILDSFSLSQKRIKRIVSQQINPDFKFMDIPALSWSRLFELNVSLSDKNTYSRLGSWGEKDGRWRALVSLRSKKGIALAAPISVIDHPKGKFAGSRWVFALFQPQVGFWDQAHGIKLIQTLADFAIQGSISLDARPTLGNYRPKETPALHVEVTAPKRVFKASLEIQKLDFGKPGAIVVSRETRVDGHWIGVIDLPRPSSSGLHEFLVTLRGQSRVFDVQRTGYWRSDLSPLTHGKSFSAGSVYLRRGGRVYPILGTTYMASDVHRYFLLNPNPAVFERDMRILQNAGFNMLRTGVWTGWDKLAHPDGSAKKKTLRAAEAFFLSAKRHHLPIQFNFFAFMPDVFGGDNAYLDPEAIHREENWVLSFTRHFKNDPDVMWDLINEPSFDQLNHFFGDNTPNQDAFEKKAWTRWLLKRYRTREAIARVWNEPSSLLGSGPLLPLPEDGERHIPWDRLYSVVGHNAVKAYDFNLFAQDVFNGWIKEMVGAIRKNGSRQMITAGQDAGGNMNRLLNPFFAKALNFTDNHIWGDADAVLWNVIVTKAPGVPNLMQETGIKRLEAPDGSERLSEDQKAAILERRMAAALGAGSAGSIEWVWNVNVLMTDHSEVSIGAVRGDGTEKPEADVLRNLTAFTQKAFPYFTTPKPMPVALILPQSLQLSAEQPLETQATQAAVRTLAYRLRAPVRVVGEIDIESLFKNPPQLAILPSAQILSDQGWEKILKLTKKGVTTLITGPVERDEHFQRVARLTALKPLWKVQALVSRDAFWGGLKPLSFGRNQDFLDLEYLKGPQGLSEIHWGKGRLLVNAYPAELNDDLSALSEVYASALFKAGISPKFQTNLTDPSVLISRTAFSKAILYLFLSESNVERKFWIEDPALKKFSVVIPAGRAELALYERGTGRLIAQYFPPDQ